MEHRAEMMQSTVIAGERVVYTSGAIMGFEFLGHKPKPKWTTPAIQVLDINKAQGHHPGPLCDKHGSLSGGVCR